MSEPEVQDEDKIEENKPRFVIVELKQLEKLVQRCPECGKLPGGSKIAKPRSINWTRKVTKMKRSLAYEDWKKDMVDKSLERKQQIDMGNPVDPDQDDIDEDLDIVTGQSDELLNFNDTDDDFVG